MNLSILLNEKNGLITNEELPCITADETQLMQLFQNLISNGIKYNISVSPHVHISATEEKSDWIFSIKDNGIGIEKEFYERIFGIFQRLHSRDEYSGTGIGLAICRRIVDRHGGRIWLESEIDKGTVFYFSIPK
jgi:light-regulated signal transduction histidine kinase (bacteriophytochrome)